MTLPEGLRLYLIPDWNRGGVPTPVIIDAQDVVWLRFGCGKGDPVEWLETVLVSACEPLDILTGDAHDDGEGEVSLPEFAKIWHLQTNGSAS